MLRHQLREAHGRRLFGVEAWRFISASGLRFFLGVQRGIERKPRISQVLFGERPLQPERSQEFGTRPMTWKCAFWLPPPRARPGTLGHPLGGRG